AGPGSEALQAADREEDHPRARGGGHLADAARLRRRRPEAAGDVPRPHQLPGQRAPVAARAGVLAPAAAGAGGAEDRLRPAGAEGEAGGGRQGVAPARPRRGAAAEGGRQLTPRLAAAPLSPEYRGEGG